MNIGERFYAIAQKISECLCAEVGKGLCYCGIIMGDETAPLGIMQCGDTRDCGIAWVRPVEIYSSGAFPVPDVEVGPRSAGPLAMSFEVGVARCHPRPQGRAQHPNPDEMSKAFEQYMCDMAAVRRAILCCLQSRDPLWADLTSMMGPWRPLPADGGASGGVWTAYVQ